MISNATKPIAVRGCCHLFCALDIGFAVDLKQCAGLIREAREGYGFHHHARTPPYLNLRPLPVHASQTIEPIRGQTYCSEDRVTITIYDFGAVSVKYRVPFEGAPNNSPRSAASCTTTSASPPMRSTRGITAGDHRPGGQKAEGPRAVEDYLVFEVPELEGDDGDPERFLSENGQVLAQVLGSNTEALSAQQQREELSGRVSYYANDLTIITWNAALVFGKNMEDVLTVLELANVQLRELHYLDDQLDDSLRESYDISARIASVKARMRRIRELMLDGQSFSESVTNAFKPFADAFLARVYVLASSSLGLNQFDQSIKNKLNLLNTLYATLSDEADHERSVRLEWIVIVLIAVEILVGFSEKIPWLFGRR